MSIQSNIEARASKLKMLGNEVVKNDFGLYCKTYDGQHKLYLYTDDNIKEISQSTFGDNNIQSVVLLKHFILVTYCNPRTLIGLYVRNNTNNLIGHATFVKKHRFLNSMLSWLSPPDVITYETELIILTIDKQVVLVNYLGNMLILDELNSCDTYCLWSVGNKYTITPLDLLGAVLCTVDKDLNIIRNSDTNN